MPTDFLSPSYDELPDDFFEAKTVMCPSLDPQMSEEDEPILEPAPDMMSDLSDVSDAEPEPSTTRVRRLKKNLGPRSQVKRRYSAISSSSSSESSYTNKKSSGPMNFASGDHDVDGDLPGFVLPDNVILFDDDHYEQVSPEKKTRQQKKKKSKRLKQGSKGSKKDPDSSSEDDAEAPIENEDGETEYVVEAIRKTRMKNGIQQFFIKWAGYPETDNTWEPESNLQNCGNILSDFKKRLVEREKAGKQIWDIDFSEEEYPDDEFSDVDDVELWPLDDVLDPVLKKCGLSSKSLNDSIPGNLPPALQCLAPKEWFTNFVIDDAITFLLNLYGMSDRVVYVDHNLFSMVFNSIETKNGIPGFLPVQVINFLYKHSAFTAPVVLVATSTSTGSDEKSDVSPSAEHFALGLICKFEEKIILLDSIDDTNRLKPRETIFKSLYSIMEAMYRLATPQPLACPDEVEFIYSKDCIKQNNYYDCGPYVLLNVIMMLTKRIVDPKSIRSRTIRRALYLMLKNKVSGTQLDIEYPDGKKEDEPTGAVQGAVKREVQQIIKNLDVIVKRRNTNALLVSPRLLK